MEQEKDTEEDKKEQPVIKQRKVHAGRQKNKERTKGRIIEAVGKVLENEGYANLNTVKIAKETGLDKKLIRAYFGDLEHLLEDYILHKDFLEIRCDNNY
ncbi:TetR/AcrR family transcriptional regulator [Leadbetterella byssophila]|uniref:TetR/AcrR family transcriptional regulator n=1 Tax=Leadbetterella byssophila TaxID=316068 RepID=UPI00031D8B8D|nr:TetR/AcrR family transcriptional regulator [Leadbetterella byssophila]